MVRSSCALIAVALLCCGAAHVAAIAQLCNPNAPPVTPQKVRIEGQRYDSAKKLTQVTIAFDNPTTSKTGCITAYTVSIRDAKGQALGGKSSLSSPITNPIRYVSWQKPQQQYTISFVETETKAGRKARATPNLTYITNGPVGVVPLAASG